MEIWKCFLLLNKKSSSYNNLDLYARLKEVEQVLTGQGTEGFLSEKKDV